MCTCLVMKIIYENLKYTFHSSFSIVLFAVEDLLFCIVSLFVLYCIVLYCIVLYWILFIVLYGMVRYGISNKMNLWKKFRTREGNNPGKVRARNSKSKRLSRKSPGWELVHKTNLQDSRKILVRSKRTSRKSPVCDKEHQICTQKSLENSGLPMEFI
jgi:hypothetical protein